MSNPCANCDLVEYDLCLEQGVTEILRVGPWTESSGGVVTDVASFTGYEARASARRGFGVGPALWTRSSEETSPYPQITFEDWTDPADSTVYPDAIIVIHWQTDITEGLTNPTKHAVWDLEIYDSGSSPEIVDRVLQGSYCVALGVTE